MKSTYTEPKLIVSVCANEDILVGSDVIVDAGDLFSESDE